MWHLVLNGTNWSLAVRRSVAMEQVGEIEGGRVMKGFVSEKENLYLIPLWNWKPVMLLDDRSEVITGRD